MVFVTEAAHMEKANLSRQRKHRFSPYQHWSNGLLSDYSV